MTIKDAGDELKVEDFFWRKFLAAFLVFLFPRDSLSSQERNYLSPRGARLVKTLKRLLLHTDMHTRGFLLNSSSVSPPGTHYLKTVFRGVPVNKLEN